MICRRHDFAEVIVPAPHPILNFDYPGGITLGQFATRDGNSNEWAHDEGFEGDIFSYESTVSD